MRFFGVLATILLAASFTAISGGQAPAQDDVPNLIGTWSADYTTNRYSGIDERSLEVVIDEQEGPLFRGTKSWSSDANAAPGDAGGKLVTSAEEPILGVIDFDGSTLHIAEVGDRGSYVGRVVDENSIQLVYQESGDTASVYRVTLQRAAQ